MPTPSQIVFLKQVFLHAITAFGGPQGHIGMILKRFVEQHGFLTEAELFEYNNFCQILPGPSSTQLITIIGYKVGGTRLALLTLLIWILPATFLMGLFSFTIIHFSNQSTTLNHFRFLQPMAIGFIIYSSIRAYKLYINNTITTIIMLFSAGLIIYFFALPWIIPILFLTGGIVTNFSKKRFPSKSVNSKISFKWKYLILFFTIFIVLGSLSEISRKQQWSEKKLLNLSENFYRFGTIVFGGGDVLLPMLMDQYVQRPTIKKIQQRNPNIIKVQKDELLTGYGFVRAIPGPVFSVSAFVGGISFKDRPSSIQLLGILTATISIFLPGVLLVFFAFPIWQSLKENVYITRSFEGVGSVTVGLLIGTCLFLLKDYFTVNTTTDQLLNLGIIALTVLITTKTKIPPPVLVLLCLLLGFII